jgi:hypothetical protein
LSGAIVATPAAADAVAKTSASSMDLVVISLSIIRRYLSRATGAGCAEAINQQVQYRACAAKPVRAFVALIGAVACTNELETCDCRRRLRHHREPSRN